VNAPRFDRDRLGDCRLDELMARNYPVHDGPLRLATPPVLFPIVPDTTDGDENPRLVRYCEAVWPTQTAWRQ
jgi:hypothetical protein